MGVGKGKTANPQSFFVFVNEKNKRTKKGFYGLDGFKLLSLLAIPNIR